MKTYAQLEADHLALCKRVETDAMNIFGLAGIGNNRQAAEAAAILAEHAATVKAQYKMQQEQAGDWNLRTLKVDATSASNSETGFEDRG